MTWYYLYFDFVMEVLEEFFVDLFIVEIEEGVECSEYWVGVIKVVMMGDIIEWDRWLFIVVVQMYVCIGVLILIYCEVGFGGIEQVVLFEDFGVVFVCIVLFYIDKVFDDGYYWDFLVIGVNFVYDQVLCQLFQEEESMFWFVVEMIDVGYID